MLSVIYIVYGVMIRDQSDLIDSAITLSHSCIVIRNTRVYKYCVYTEKKYFIKCMHCNVTSLRSTKNDYLQRNIINYHEILCSTRQIL